MQFDKRGSMFPVYDRSGFQSSVPQPGRTLTTKKKIILVDSIDRDTVKYPDPGHYALMLPRVYEHVKSIRLVSAEITAPTGNFAATDRYILVSIDGLNKYDETAKGAQRSGLVDSVFAKIPVQSQTATIFYNDQSYAPNITTYTPDIGRVDRLDITFRRHGDGANGGVTGVSSTGIITFGTGKENSMTLEIEYME